MQIKRHSGTGLVAAGLLTLAFVTAGCGGSSSKATPLGSSDGSAPSTTVSTATSSGAPGGSGSTSTPAGASTTTPASGVEPTAAQLSAVSQQLDLAGTSLSGTDSAISGSDVNQAKAQEGSAP